MGTSTKVVGEIQSVLNNDNEKGEIQSILNNDNEKVFDDEMRK